MKSANVIVWIGVLAFFIACEDGSGSSNTFISYDYDVSIPERKKAELNKYFEVLDAKAVRVRIFYDEDTYEEYLKLEIENSRFLVDNYPKNQAYVSCKRLADLLYERMEDVEALTHMVIEHIDHEERDQSFSHEFRFEFAQSLEEAP